MAALQARIATLEAALGNSAKLDELAKRLDRLPDAHVDDQLVVAGLQDALT